jgi:hypothetical protein
VFDGTGSSVFIYESFVVCGDVMTCPAGAKQHHLELSIIIIPDHHQDILE